MPSPRSGLPKAALRALPVVLLMFLASCKDKIIEPIPVTPADAVVVDVDLDTDSTKLVIQDTVRVAVTVTDSKGAATTAFSVTWASSDPNILRSLGDGTFVAVAPGSAFIVATSEGVSATATVAVVVADVFENVVVADSAFQVLSDSAEISSGTLRLSRVGNQDPVAVGDVMVGTEGGGFIRRVTAVQSNGAEVVVSTTQATMLDVIKQGTIEFEDTTSFAAAAAAVSADPSLFQVPPRQGVYLQPDGTVRFEAATFDFTTSNTVGIGPLSASVTVDGTLRVKVGQEAMPGGKTAAFSADIETFAGFPTGLERLEFSTATAVELDTKLTTSVIGSLSSAVGKEVFRETLFRIPLGRKIFFVGPVPVLVRLSIPVQAYAVITAQVEANMEIESELAAGAQVGLTWTPKGGFKNNFTPFGSATIGEPEFAVGGRLGLRFGVDPKLEMSFYEGVGAVAGGIDGAISADLFATTQYTWDGQVEALLDLFLQANLDLWGLVGLGTRSELHLWADTLFQSSGDLAYVGLSPDAITVEQGKTATVAAKALTIIGDLDLGLKPEEFDWFITPTSVATVDNKGMVTGVSAGSATVSARIKGTTIQASIPVTVAQPALVLQGCFGPLSWSLGGPPLGTCPTDEPVASFSQGSESSYLWMRASVPGSSLPTGVTYTAKNPFTGQTVTPSSGVNGWHIFKFSIPANQALGDYKVTVGPASKAGLKDATAIEVPFKVVLGKLVVAACLSTDASPSFDANKHCPSDFQTVGVKPGETMYLWYGADSGGVAQCGAQIAVKNPFTGQVLQTAIPIDQPGCLGRLTVPVPQGTATGEYTMVIGPATKAGYADAQPLNFPFPVR